MLLTPSPDHMRERDSGFFFARQRRIVGRFICESAPDRDGSEVLQPCKQEPDLQVSSPVHPSGSRNSFIPSLKNIRPDLHEICGRPRRMKLGERVGWTIAERPPRVDAACDFVRLS